MHRSLRAAPQQRIGLPPLANATDQRSDVVAVLDTLHRTQGYQLFGKPMRGRLRPPARVGQRGQAQPVVGMGERFQYRKRTVEDSPASTRVRHGRYR